MLQLHTDQIVTFLAGPDSDLFHAYKKIVHDATYSDFAEWLGAFFFSCRMGQNYNKLSGKSRIDSSDFADAKDYNHVWRMMDRYAKGDPDTEGNDSGDETPPLELSAPMRVRFKKILEVLGEM